MTHPLMQYLPPVQQQRAPQQRQPQQEHGAYKFKGTIADGYDAKREKEPKWVLEQAIVEDMLADLPPDTVVLDCPVGTGRFLPFYARKDFQVIGMDISEDMLRKALAKGGPTGLRGELGLGDIRDTKLPDKSVDISVCVRVTRWLMGNHGPEGIVAMLREMRRVSRQRIILTARVANHKLAVTEDLIKSALSGWSIVRNEVGVDLDYRIICCEPA